MTNKKLLMMAVFVTTCSYAMEGQLVLGDPSDQVELYQPKSLYETCWKWLESRKKAEIAKITEDYGKPEALEGIIAKLVKRAIKTKKPGYIICLANKLPISLYPKIGFKILKSERFTHVKREKMLSALCWSHVLDQETKKILKIFVAHCHMPNEFLDRSYNASEYDFFVQSLSWRALRDIASDAPYKFLLSRKTFRLMIPKKIINYLLKMNIKRGLQIQSSHHAQQLLQRIDFVLEHGASVDANIDLEGTSFNYVLNCARFYTGGGLFEEILGDQQATLQIQFYKRTLKLFVEHLMKRNDGLLFVEQHIRNYEELSLDQKVEKLMESSYKRHVFDFSLDHITL